MPSEPVFKEYQGCFTEAIKTGLLSETHGTDNYAAKFMYMGTWNGIDKFKSIKTRKYIS